MASGDIQSGEAEENIKEKTPSKTTLLLLLSLSITASPLLRDVYLFLFPSSPPLILRSKIEMRRLEDVEPVAATSLAVVLKLVGLLVRRFYSSWVFNTFFRPPSPVR